MEYNLVSEPWLPVRRGSVVQEVSLAELFDHPDEFDDLDLAFAPERIAVLRLLSAIVLSPFTGPVDRRVKLDWLRDPRPCLERILEYLDDWRGRFNLFHGERPFMQQPVDPSSSGDLSVAALALDWASGNNVTLFDHHVDARPVGVEPARAVRMLLAALLCQPGGGVSKPFNRTDSPGTKSVMAVALGRDLWQTLLGACPELGADVTADQEARRKGTADAPAWERDLDREQPDKAGNVPLGWLDLATWRSRAVQLIPDPTDGLVRRVRVHQHMKLAENRPPDPYVPVSRRPGEEPRPVRVDPGRRLWRQADAIFHGLAESDHSTVVRTAVTLFAHLDPDYRPRLFCAGLEVQQAKIVDSRGTWLPVNEELLRDEDRLEVVAEGLEGAQGGSRAVRAAVRALNASLISNHAKDPVSRWEERYWGQLRTPFIAFVEEVVSASQVPSFESDTWDRWTEAVRGAAWEVLLALWTAKGSGDDRLFEGLAKARAALQRELDEKVPKVEREVVDAVAG